MDPHHLHAFLFAELSEIDSADAHNVIQVGACLAFWYWGWAGMAWTAWGSRYEAAALHGVRRKQV